MPKKITPDVRAKIIMEWMRGTPIAHFADDFQMTEQGIHADKKKYVHVWKLRAREFLCRDLQRVIEHRKFIAKHLERYAVTDKEHFDFIEEMRNELQTLDRKLKRVATLFKEKGKKQVSEGETQ